jgi:hypothetical protein
MKPLLTEAEIVARAADTKAIQFSAFWWFWFPMLIWFLIFADIWPPARDWCSRHLWLLAGVEFGALANMAVTLLLVRSHYKKEHPTHCPYCRASRGAQYCCRCQRHMNVTAVCDPIEEHAEKANPL